MSELQEVSGGQATATSSSSVAGPNAEGAAATGNPVRVAGATSGGTQVHTVLVDAVGQLASGPVTGLIFSGGVALTPKFAFANVAASQTDAALVALVATKKIRVHQLIAIAGATATNLTFTTKPGGAGTAITPLFANGINGGEVLPFSPAGWFETAAGEGLSVTTGAGSTTGILVLYTEV